MYSLGRAELDLLLLGSRESLDDAVQSHHLQTLNPEWGYRKDSLGSGVPAGSVPRADADGPATVAYCW